MKTPCFSIYSRHCGLTLIELIVTVALVAIMASIAAPGFRDMVEKATLARSQDLVVQALKQAKRIARSQGTMVKVTFSNTPTNIKLEPSNGDEVNYPISDGIEFDAEADITFSSLGTTTPLQIQTKNGSSDSRYVDVTASGQIAVHHAGYTN